VETAVCRERGRGTDAAAGAFVAARTGDGGAGGERRPAVLGSERRRRRGRTQDPHATRRTAGPGGESERIPRSYPAARSDVRHRARGDGEDLSRGGVCRGGAADRPRAPHRAGAAGGGGGGAAGVPARG